MPCLPLGISSIDGDSLVVLNGGYMANDEGSRLTTEASKFVEKKACIIANADDDTSSAVTTTTTSTSSPPLPFSSAESRILRKMESLAIR